MFLTSCNYELWAVCFFFCYKCSSCPIIISSELYDFPPYLKFFLKKKLQCRRKSCLLYFLKPLARFGLCFRKKVSWQRVVYSIKPIKKPTKLLLHALACRACPWKKKKQENCYYTPFFYAEHVCGLQQNMSMIMTSCPPFFFGWLACGEEHETGVGDGWR